MLLQSVSTYDEKVKAPSHFCNNNNKYRVIRRNSKMAQTREKPNKKKNENKF